MFFLTLTSLFAPTGCLGFSQPQNTKRNDCEHKTTAREDSELRRYSCNTETFSLIAVPIISTFAICAALSRANKFYFSSGKSFFFLKPVSHYSGTCISLFNINWILCCCSNTSRARLHTIWSITSCRFQDCVWRSYCRQWKQPWVWKTPQSLSRDPSFYDMITVVLQLWKAGFFTLIFSFGDNVNVMRTLEKIRLWLI